MRSITIEKIGFFHCIDFGNFGTPADAVAKLTIAIEKRILEGKESDPAWDVGNSLIVLPEAFNFRDYNSHGAAEPPGPFLASLSELAGKHGLLFVTGLLDGRRNVAYLVDGSGAQLMCHKIGEDGTGFYDPYTGQPDPCNPITFHNACVGALICIDAADDDGTQPHIRKRLEGFLERLSASQAKHKIVCVPARFIHPRSYLEPFAKMEDGWYVVAQGKFTFGKGPSFVAECGHNSNCPVNVDCSHVKIRATDNQNQVKIWPLPMA